MEINQYFNSTENKGKTSPSRILMHNKTLTNKSDIAEQFNKYFIRRGTWGEPEHRNTAKKKINEHRITARKIDETPSPQQLFLAI